MLNKCGLNTAFDVVCIRVCGGGDGKSVFRYQIVGVKRGDLIQRGTGVVYFVNGM